MALLAPQYYWAALTSQRALREIVGSPYPNGVRPSSRLDGDFVVSTSISIVDPT
jgi:hypothetical protein